MPFRLPEFSRLAPRLDRSTRELGQLRDFYDRNGSEVAAGDWGALSAADRRRYSVARVLPQRAPHPD
jgi:hypothetical protein